MSDPNLLEFWGNYLIAVARGQKQLQDVDRWVRRNFEGMEDLAAMFKQAISHGALGDARVETGNSTAS